MSYDDETLMAYADGELDDATRAHLEAAIARDPELAKRVRQFRALRTELAGAYSTVLDQPVPERLRDAARGPAADKPLKGNVVQFPARGTRAPAAPWRAREWFAMAASLVLGMMLSWKFLAPAGDVTTKSNALVARGELRTALDGQLASTQSAEASVHIGVSFKDAQGDYCRTYVSRATSTAGLACRDAGDWRIVQTNSVEIPGGDLRQAAASLPPSLLQALEPRMAGEALDAAGEQAARDAGWK